MKTKKNDKVGTVYILQIMNMNVKPLQPHFEGVWGWHSHSWNEDFEVL
jgi:hypothetical protein